MLEANHNFVWLSFVRVANCLSLEKYTTNTICYNENLSLSRCSPPVPPNLFLSLSLSGRLSYINNTQHNISSTTLPPRLNKIEVGRGGFI